MLRLIVTVCAAMLFAVRCAHTPTERHLDQRMDEESKIKSTSDLRIDAQSAIDSATGLTDEQKTKLKALGASVRVKLDDLRDQSLKLRAVLVDDMIATNYNVKEVELIKQRIKAVENNRVSTMFKAIDDANEIMGRQAKLNQHVFLQFAETHGNLATP